MAMSLRVVMEKLRGVELFQNDTLVVMECWIQDPLTGKDYTTPTQGPGSSLKKLLCTLHSDYFLLHHSKYITSI